MSDAFRPAVMTALTQYSPKKTVSKSFALFRLSINLGMAIGPFAGGFLAGANYSYLFWVDGLTCVLAGLVFWFLRHRFLSSESPVSEKHEGTYETACHPEKDIQFIFFLVIIFGLGFAFFQLLGVYPLYLKDVFGFVEREIGMFLGFNAFLIVCFEMVLIHFLQKVNPLNVFALGVFLVCLGFGLLPLGEWIDHRHLFVMGLTVIWSVGEMMSMPIANTIVAQRAPNEYRGAYMGLYASTWSIALMIAPPLGILIYNRAGRFLFWFSILFLGIVLAVATRFVFPGKKR
jgi:MFS family permease